MFDKERFTTLKQLWSILKPYWNGEKKSEAWRLLSVVILFLITFSIINAFKTFIPKWMINALAAHNGKLFYQFLLLGVVGLSISIPLEALLHYFIDKLGVCWRRWFNMNLLIRYFQNKAYYNMGLYSDVDNPDQRLAEDLNDFTQSSVQLFARIGTSVFTLITFSGVLWSISPWLVLSVIFYATVGNFVIVMIMRFLVKVNFLNIRYQADYRYNLVHVRDNIESIAFYKGENHEGSLLRRSFHILIENFFRLIKIKRNIMFASKAYLLFGVIFPYIILAPRILSGQAPIGLLVQAIEVFSVILIDLSIIIEQFPDISTYAAKIQRLAKFVTGLEAKPAETTPLISYNQDGEFSFKNVTVETPDLKKTLVKNLDLAIKPGVKLIIRGPSGCGKSSLLRAVAGLWCAGKGEIITPDMQGVMFLPQRPYMLLGSLREQLIYPNLASDISKEELYNILHEVNLTDLPKRVGGFDTVLKWADVLSLGEQQRIMFVRLFLNNPKYAILDESTSALDEDNEVIVYSKLQQSNISYVSVGHRSSLLKFHDQELLLDLEHGWRVLPVAKSL
ncbi:MAG: ABC transporter ATP-binding protein/permease [Gammaproteobacteria bacterium]|nr:ABC transporter ATP-binding protein/permease [Gammaproteobacteria bacterium]